MKLPMKLLRTAGLCLVAMFAMSMVAAGTASAAEIRWEQCSEGPEGKLPTKYTEHQCLTAATGNNGKWQWNEVKETEAAISQGTLQLKDLNVPVVKTVEVHCSGTNEGTIDAKGIDTITKVKVEGCTKSTNCEEFKKAEAVDLPWQTELFETEGRVRDKIAADGNGAPGWSVECKVLGVAKADRCTNETGSTLLENVKTIGAHGTELLVLANFESKSGKANCSIGGTGQGEVTGSIALLKANFWGLRFS